ncbi:hypothetical protein MUK42_15089 [Musa troglodytarum]|uniref:Uncharacterized protein n=1 Tax=Musa troglodytarum TaxID=320322 RepID=A0A9E7HZK0_9LILI|nr:hypothetical protein MUK42_15089 [Musa troglodytarum]
MEHRGIGFRFPFSCPTEIDRGREGGRARSASGKVARTSKQECHRGEGEGGVAFMQTKQSETINTTHA